MADFLKFIMAAFWLRWKKNFDLKVTAVAKFIAHTVS